MKDILEKLDQWRESNTELAVTTVIETWGSAPRQVGSKMVTTKTGKIAGSVSAGCVEGAVIQESQSVMKTGKPRLIEFGVADEEAWEVGLACGGQIQVFIEPGFALDSIYDSIKEGVENGESFKTLTVIDGDNSSINKKLFQSARGEVFGDLQVSKGIENELTSLLEIEESGLTQLSDGTLIFVEVHPKQAQLIIIGAVHMAESLITMANLMGFETILIDPREAFATKERFPQVDVLMTEWPQDGMKKLVIDSSSYIVILSHDPKVDDPALNISLQSEARYVGALGSRRTNEKRLKRLHKAGLTEEQLSRLHAPIGLPLGGRSPGEIALSVMAEIIQVMHQ